MKTSSFLLPFLFLLGSVASRANAPFDYVWGTAHHVLPETHSEESGYFSLCEGNDGRIYVGQQAASIEEVPGTPEMVPDSV